MPLSETNRYTYNLNLLNGYNQHFQVHHYSPDFFFYLFIFIFIYYYKHKLFNYYHEH